MIIRLTTENDIDRLEEIREEFMQLHIDTFRSQQGFQEFTRTLWLNLK